jgi:hypothetical protein
MRKEGFAVFCSFGQLFVAPWTVALLAEIVFDGFHVR